MENLKELLENEKKKLLSLQEKRDNIEARIKKCEMNIERYSLMQDSEKYSYLSNILEQAGLQFDEILEALKNGNLNVLQEKIKETTENTENNNLKNEDDTK